MDQEKVFPQSEFIDRFDGSKWRVFQISRGLVVLTAKGQDLLHKNFEIGRALLQYKNELKDPVRYFSGIRKWFRAGGNSDVYQLNNLPFVIKEAVTSQSVWNALNRMDYLEWVIRRYLPNHIRIPDHFGAVFSANLNRQYLLMQKVNEGLTVADIISNGNHPLLSQVVQEFHRAKLLLDAAINACRENGEWPHNLLPDWDAGNVIVDFTTPTKEFPFTLWVIDQ